jgi:cytochrome c oxidase subunit 2
MWTSTEQSALQPAGVNSQAISDLTWVMFYGGAAIFIVVMAAIGLALTGPALLRRMLGTKAMIIGGGAAFPAVVLTALLAWGFTIVRDLRAEATAPAVHLVISGEQWWWRVSYLDSTGKLLFSTANEIHLPADRAARLSLVSPDVIHSFWIPALAGKLDMIPGRTNTLTLTAKTPGTYRGQCAEYCGGQHAMMALVAVVHTPEDFDLWLKRESGPARKPLTTQEILGKELFDANGCGACHTVRGTDAAGEVGPDLSHVGSRQSLGAGSFPNNIGTLAGWVSSAQHLKPGNKMPSFDRLTGVELRALAAYLQALE